MATGINNASFTERQLVTFLLGEDEFGIDIMNVKEIIRVPDITRVPNAPCYVEGACNLRGNVLPIIDGRIWFNMERKAKDENSRVLVIDVDGKATGMIVDKVSEVMRVSMADIEDTPQIVRNVDSDYLKGVVKLDSGNRLVMLLDVVRALRVDNDGEGRIRGQDESLHNTGAMLYSTGTESIDEEQLVSFLLDEEEYAIGIMQVKEIIRTPQIVKVPNCEDYIEGVVSIRNNLLPIINLRTYFGMEHMDINDYTRILVVDMGNFTAGIMVDKVLEVLRVPKSIIQPPPKFSTQSEEQLKGVAKLNDGKRMILMLEPSKLISLDEISGIKATDGIYEQDEDEKRTGRQMVDEEQLVTFKIDSVEYGVKIANVQEINRMTEVTKIPRAPYYIEGIVNLRGNVIPALNLRKFFNLPEKQITDATRIIIIDFNGKRTGIVVDSVSEVLTFEKTLIEAPPDSLSNGVDTDYVEGVGKLNEGKRMILILDISKVLNFIIK
ncbi:chemotaxis protein CheW [Lutispora thermophila]|uniref:Purine-binding chemotaxis protein CheW n=1 Tax=Lutispora thermophila DSM 19022 TaxID=1122184 RepID=A0A1M6EJW4_9FIRM|nr:chemotaxis protein CheW [Lutispora thermophila]SHI85706.1 purine-binding chemotaxis protein CheW [Lutispora thermophila DSM 19022]